MTHLPFADRRQAGELLAARLADWRAGPDLLVLALPRGGVPVAFEIARRLGAELDVLIVRKLGAPGSPELAMGAIASGGIRVLNRDVVDAFGIDADALERVAARESQEILRREQAYRGERPLPALTGRPLLLVDDGVATGATIRAAIAALRAREPASITVAVPVAPPDTVAVLRKEADEVICLATPSPFFAIGNFYPDFGQTSDDEVRELLGRAWDSAAIAPGAG